MFYSIDVKLFYIFNVGFKNSLFDLLMPMFARHEEWIPATLILLVAGLYSNRKRCLRAFLMAVLAVALSDFIIHNFLKPFWGRTRPCNVLPPGTFHLLVGCGGSYSFPSQHASNMFAISCVFAYCYRGAKYVLILIASLVAFSRVYLGVHYPSDIFFGALFGIFSASVVIYILRRRVFPETKKRTGV